MLRNRKIIITKSIIPTFRWVQPLKIFKLCADKIDSFIYFISYLVQTQRKKSMGVNCSDAILEQKKMTICECQIKIILFRR